MSEKEKEVQKNKPNKRVSKKRRQKRAINRNNIRKIMNDTRLKSMDYIKPEAFSDKDEVIKLFGSKEKFMEWAKIVNTLAAQGPDIRKASQSLSINGFFSDSASETNKVVVATNVESYIGVAVSVIANAYNHGFRQECMSLDKSWYPYFAFLYIYKSLISVISGSQVDAPKVKVPDFLLEVFAAVAPKSGTQLGAGTLGYSWSINNVNYVPPEEFNYPSLGTQVGKFNFFIASNATEEGYNLMVAPGSSPTYDANVGGEAFSALVTFMNKRLVGVPGKYQPFAARDYKLEGTIMERSVSAFSATSLVFGGGLIGGYTSSLASLETSIKHRKFAVFAQDKSLDRGFRQHVQTGGDSNWLVCSLMLQQNKLEVKNPNYPVFVPVDFYEFADCLAMALSAAFTNAYHSNNFNTSNIPNLGLNYIEYLIILRKILMRNFSATQYGVQSLRFYPSTLGSTDDFIPYLCNSCGSSSSNNATLKLPLFMVENMNALRPRVVYPSINPKTKKQIDLYPRLYVTVLGEYTSSTFDPARYKYTDGQGNMQDLFVPTSANVNLVDGRVNGKYVDMDCSPKITTDMDIFNDKMQILSPFIQQLQMYTGDPGCIPLTVVADCRMVIEKKQDNDKKKTIRSDVCEKCGGEKEGGCVLCKKKKKKGPQIVTFNKYLVATLTQQIPIADLAPIKKAFVMPEYRLFVSNQGVGTITTSSTRSYSAEMWIEYEGQSYSATQDGNYTDMNAIRKQWVANCVKNQFGEDNSIVKQLLDLTKKGKAGLLGSLVGAFGGEIVSSALRTVGSFVPY